jgi:uncharacterized protein Veg
MEDLENTSRILYVHYQTHKLLAIREHIRKATGKANTLYSYDGRREIVEHLHDLLRIMNASLREVKEQENTDD